LRQINARGLELQKQLSAVVVGQMAASIQEFGFKVPILALSDCTIADGHLRLKAAQKHKIETVPV
jgi:ParB-like chromosome segregation protein Spo0J